MQSLWTATADALRLLISADANLWEIIGISFGVSLRALAIATIPALILAFALTMGRFPGRRLAIAVFNTLLSVPAVVIGLTVYLCLLRSGPFGDLRLLFTQQAMIIGQILMAFPVLVVLGHTALQSADLRAWETARTLGASRMRASATLMYEVRFGLFAALIAAFGRIIAEVGSALMVGGNILHYTRNITTAIALETSKGEFSQGIALGVVLLTLSLFLNVSLIWLQGRGSLGG